MCLHVDLSRQGNDAARFAATGVHTIGYSNAPAALLDWFTIAISHMP